MSIGFVHPPELAILRELVQRSIQEDLASGDVTSRAVIAPQLCTQAVVFARAPTVCSGAFFSNLVFEALDPQVDVVIHVAEGQAVSQNTKILELSGSAQSILAGERILLNLLGRSCGVAKHTRTYVEAVAGGVRVVDTRKTMPGMRALDRYAVRCGGGFNHRNDLGSGILIKENHVRCAGGIAAAIEACRQKAPHTLRIECEVQTLAELEQAIEAGADIVMLDNMSDTQIEQAVRQSAGRVLLEASGGLNLERVSKLAQMGLDLVSVGALTHSAPVADLSMLIEFDEKSIPTGSIAS